MSTMKKIVWMVVLAVSFTACKKAKKPDPEVAKEKKVSATAAELGMKQEAIASFQKAIDELGKEKPDNAVAIEALQKSVAAEPEFAEAHYNLGLLYLNLGDQEKAQRHLEAAKQIDPDELDYTVALGRAQAEVGNYDAAKALFSEVVAREPNNLAAKNNLAVLAFRQDDDETALKHLQEILREDSENVPALLTLGQVYHKKGNLSLAKYVFKRAIKVDDKNPDLHNNLGLVYLDEENVPDAVDEFSKAIKHNPNYLESRLNLGAILLEYLDYERASNEFTEAVRIAPSHCVARLGNAAALYALGKHEASAKDYQYYVDNCDAKHVSSYERLAKLNESFLNDPKAAVGYYKELLTLVDDEEKKTNYNAMINFLESQTKKQEQKAPESEPEEEAQPDEASEEAAEEAAE
jgi:tetratricopeptide (TPR) repeat protein